MSAVLSDQAIELLMAMSTGALARAGAKKYPAMAQHFGVKPGAPPAEQSAAEVPAMAAPADAPAPRSIPKDTTSAANRALIGRVPAGVASRTPIPTPWGMRPAKKGSSEFMRREGIDPSELYNRTNQELINKGVPGEGPKQEAV